MDEPAYKVKAVRLIHNKDDVSFAGYGDPSAPLESPVYATCEEIWFSVDPQEGKKIYRWIEDKCVELMENFDTPEYVVINRQAFLHLMAYISTEIKTLPHMSTAPKLHTCCGPVTLIPVNDMSIIEIVGDIHRKVYTVDNGSIGSATR